MVRCSFTEADGNAGFRFAASQVGFRVDGADLKMSFRWVSINHLTWGLCHLLCNHYNCPAVRCFKTTQPHAAGVPKQPSQATQKALFGRVAMFRGAGVEAENANSSDVEPT